MITARYIGASITLNTLAISAVLLVIISSTQLLRYLDEVAEGTLGLSALLPIVAYRIPEAAQTILSLALFISVILTLNRLRMNNELVALATSGMHSSRLLGNVMLPATILATLIAVLSLYVSPYSNRQTFNLIYNDEGGGLISTLTPKKFQYDRQKNTYRYIDHIDRQSGSLNTVFIQLEHEETLSDSQTWIAPSILSAKNGLLLSRENSQLWDLVLEDGVYYSGGTHSGAGAIARFSHFTSSIKNASRFSRQLKINGLPTQMLLAKPWRPERLANFAARVSLPLSALLLSLLAVSMCPMAPRREAPARSLLLALPLLLYVACQLALLTAQSRARNDFSWLWSFAAVHGALILLTLPMLWRNHQMFVLTRRSKALNIA